MKKTILKLSIAAIVAVTMFAIGCKKLDRSPNVDENEVFFESRSATVDINLTESDVIIDNTTNELYIDGEGLHPNAWINENDFTETFGPAGGDSSEFELKRKRYARKKASFIYCLRDGNYTKEEKGKISKALLSYQNCKENVVQRARTIYQNVKAEFAGKFERTRAALKSGSLTQAQYEAAVLKLRQEFATKVRSLNLAEKVNSRIRECLVTLLRNLKQSMTEKEWKAFVICFKP